MEKSHIIIGTTSTAAVSGFFIWRKILRTKVANALREAYKNAPSQTNKSALGAVLLYAGTGIVNITASKEVVHDACDRIAADLVSWLSFHVPDSIELKNHITEKVSTGTGIPQPLINSAISALETVNLKKAGKKAQDVLKG